MITGHGRIDLIRKYESPRHVKIRTYSKDVYFIYYKYINYAYRNNII